MKDFEWNRECELLKGYLTEYDKGYQDGRKETAEFWYDKIDTTLLVLWKANCITAEQYNAWIVTFNGFAKHFGVEIKE